MSKSYKKFLLLFLMLAISLSLSACSIKLSTTSSVPSEVQEVEEVAPKTYEEMTVEEKMEYKSVVEIVKASDYNKELLAPAYDEQTELWGYINLQGEWIITPQYKEASAFNNGYASVKDAYQDVLIIDKEGKTVFESLGNIPFKSAGVISEEGIVSVELKSDVSVSGCYYNTETKTGFNLAALPYMNGYSYVTNAYVELASPFRNGKAVVMRVTNQALRDNDLGDFKESAHIIDSKGGLIASLPAGLDVPKDGFDDNMRIILTDADGKYGLANAAGKVVVEPQYELMQHVEGDFYMVKNGTFYGFIDKQGKNAIKAAYRNAMPFSEGLAAVNDGTGWGFIDEEGKIVIPCEFDEVAALNGDGAFIDGIALAKKGKFWGIINKEGEIVFAAEAEECPVVAVCNGYISYVYKDGSGVFTVDGEYVLAPEFGYIGEFR